MQIRFSKKAILIGLLMIWMANSADIFSQIPETLVKELDQYNEKIYKGLLILNNEPESVAISKLKGIKDELLTESIRLTQKLEALPDLTEEQDQAFMEKQMAKPLYQNMINLLSDPGFLQKIEESPELTKEYMELMAMMDLGEPEEEEYEYE